MDTAELKQAAYEANLALVRAGLVVLTWGNASAVDRQSGIMAIKPSGVDYDVLQADDMVLVRLDTGKAVDTRLRPSSDTPTHLEIYRAFGDVGGVVHTHSTIATAWAQACREIPCLGTTHADAFHGPVPLTRALSDEEITRDYEVETGRVIVERFRQGGLDPLHAPGVLVAHHGPFTWGATAARAVESAITLEEVARMAQATLGIAPDAAAIPEALLRKHFERKHGAGAYYGQG